MDRKLIRSEWDLNSGLAAGWIFVNSTCAWYYKIYFVVFVKKKKICQPLLITKSSRSVKSSKLSTRQTAYQIEIMGYTRFSVSADGPNYSLKGNIVVGQKQNGSKTST